MPRVIQVIQSEECRGEGTEIDVCRTVVRYHTLDGEFLAELDPSAGRWSPNIFMPAGYELRKNRDTEMMELFKNGRPAT